jgi:ABC-type multidrug transport system fused ATPase/permease subunit
VGVVSTRLARDATLVDNMLTSGITNIMQNTLTAVFGFTIAMVSGWQLTLIVLLLSPLAVLHGKNKSHKLKVSTKHASVVVKVFNSLTFHSFVPSFLGFVCRAFLQRVNWLLSQLVRSRWTLLEAYKLLLYLVFQTRC